MSTDFHPIIKCFPAVNNVHCITGFTCEPSAASNSIKYMDDWSLSGVLVTRTTAERLSLSSRLFIRCCQNPVLSSQVSSRQMLFALFSESMKHPVPKAIPSSLMAYRKLKAKELVKQANRQNNPLSDHWFDRLPIPETLPITIECCRAKSCESDSLGDMLHILTDNMKVVFLV